MVCRALVIFLIDNDAFPSLSTHCAPVIYKWSFKSHSTAADRGSGHSMNTANECEHLIFRKGRTENDSVVVVLARDTERRCSERQSAREYATCNRGQADPLDIHESQDNRRFGETFE